MRSLTAEFTGYPAGLVQMVERARREFGPSARLWVEGFEIDDSGEPITAGPIYRQRGTWLQQRLAVVREARELDDELEALRR